ncbi:MAG TPA: PfkB family carbohydrate kinase [Hanamia sp.]|nr:PfkB family carbohydrate kinase [Hanamia sp.]
MYDICCIGHLTLDKVITPDSSLHMAGGTSFYFSNAIRNMDARYILITSLAEKEKRFVENLREKGVTVNVSYGSKTVYFENIYSRNLDHREQKVLQTGDIFSLDQIEEIEATIFHLGPLLAGDIPLGVIKALSEKGKVSLDVQGYLRKVKNQNVYSIDWRDKREALQFVDILKANETEMVKLTGTGDVRKGAKLLRDWGAKEIVITLGSKGSVIYADHTFYDIPAFVPARETDATGCGDTYMAGYLYQRIKHAGIQEAGEFGAAMASLKIESHGPFTGTEADVLKILYGNKKGM